MAATKRVHTSKIDLWVGVVVGTSIATSFAAIFIASRESYDLTAPVAFSLLAAWMGIAAVSWPMEYEIDEELLTIRSGFIKWKIPLHTILHIQPTNNPISSPAWSLDRLMIRYRKDDGEEYICISPRDRVDFYDDLAQADPNLEIEGNKMMRRDFSGL